MPTPRPVHLALTLTLAGASTAQGWTRFRGPDGQGIAPDARPPTRFSEATIHWRVTDLGRGHSSPVLWGDRLFLTRQVGDDTEIELCCFAADDGEPLWSFTIDIERYRNNEFNSYATATPTVDGDAVYVVWQSGATMFAAAVDHDGAEIWRASLGSFVGQQGSAASPILVGDVLVVAKEGEEGTGAVLALDRTDGDPLWTLERPSVHNGTCYASPIVYRPAGAEPVLVLSNTAAGVLGVDPSDGSRLWQAESEFANRFIGTPALSGNRLMYTAGKRTSRKQGAVIELPSGERAQPRRLYALGRVAPYVASPIAVGGRFFVFSDAGIASCVDAESGDELWRERLGDTRFFSSPVSDGRHLFVIDHGGTLFCLAAGDELVVLGTYELDEAVIATPALAGDCLYVRTAEQLICFRDGNRVPARRRDRMR